MIIMLMLLSRARLPSIYLGAQVLRQRGKKISKSDFSSMNTGVLIDAFPINTTGIVFLYKITPMLFILLDC